MEALDEQTLKMHVVPADLPVMQLSVRAAFEGLTPQEKKYAHFISRASWMGALICLDQTSPESPGIFKLFQTLFRNASVESIREAALAAGTSQADFNHFLNYVAAFYGNMGNYLSFGDTKFIPALSKQKFAEIIDVAPLNENARDTVMDLRQSVLDALYSLTPRERELGFPDRPAVSTYYSPFISRENIDLVTAFMNERNISPYNTRLFHIGQDPVTGLPLLALKIACAKPEHVAETVVYQQKAVIQIVYGDYNGALAAVAENLTLALPHAANPNQTAMLEHYIRHFTDGHIDDHKHAQRAWIKDIGPTVESNIGFIESYRDPAGVRGEFEGFVAVVNKETSRKFADLVNAAPTFLATLPWGASYEKDVFLRPDFTSLEVISFASSGVPAGINIPNYDDIRQNEGFKNVSLGNVLSAGGVEEKMSFIRDEDQKMAGELKRDSFEVQVGCHELLGHGSGKLFVEDAEGKFNFDRNTINPLTGRPVEHWYRGGASYDSVFGTIGSSLEECRAECVGIYLSANYDLLRIFGFEGQHASDIMYVNWLNMARAGVLGLEFYSPETNAWRQAHMQARFAILRTLLQASEEHSAAHPDVQPFLALHIDQDNQNAVIHMNRDLIHTVGVPAIARFLTKIQVYKSTADFQGAHQMYIGELTHVNDYFVNLRKIVLAKKKPRRVFVQAHTRIENDEVVLEEFPASAEGMIASFVARY